MSTNEMAMPVTDYSQVEPADYPTADVSVVMGSPYTSRKPEDVTIYANSITPVMTGDEGGGAVAAFDVVFSVGVNCGNGQSKTYQVVKRIGVDKCKMAADAESSTPVSVVEGKQSDAATTKRYRILAGLE